MKTTISILLLLLSFHFAKAQENTARKDFLFVDPVTKKQTKVETGNNVSIRFKLPDIKITGTILSLSDSLLVLGIHQEPFRQVVLFRNIATIAVIAEAKKIYIARVTLKTGETLKGVLIRIDQDSLTIKKNIRALQLTLTAATAIRSIRIHRKGAIGRGIAGGAGAGGIIGAIIGYASYKPVDCSNSFICIDFGPEFDAIGGGIIGAAAGSIVGIAIGSASQEFKIEGDQSQFDLFANEFKNKVSAEISK